MQFSSLGSGSKGNATLVRAGETCVLVDCGFPLRTMRERLQWREIEPESLTAILVTHEHNDHIAGVGPLARKFKIPVWMTHGTASSERSGKLPIVNYFDAHTDFMLGELRVSPFPVPHDAREPCQFVFDYQGLRLGIVTDVGSVTPFMVKQLDQCDGLLLECNHDLAMLQQGPYPPSLKQRVGSDYGHLNNQQAAQLLAKVISPRLQCVVAAHLSQENNHPDHVLGALREVLGTQQDKLMIADQNLGFDWQQLQTDRCLEQLDVKVS